MCFPYIETVSFNSIAFTNEPFWTILKVNYEFLDLVP